MRVVGGKLRHRTIEMTGLETTRETQDKVRQAIFNMIGPYFDGGIVIDAFAGSGAMGIEAYSRGMEKIYLNDYNVKAIEVCRRNCNSLNITNVSYSTLDYQDFFNQLQEKAHLIILDPPYKMNDIIGILKSANESLASKGILVFEMAKDSTFPEEYLGLKLIKNKIYGIKRVVVYRSE